MNVAPDPVFGIGLCAGGCGLEIGLEIAIPGYSTFDGKRFRGLVRIISAGFPCQPFSVAGKRKGTGDERWIWPDIARIIGEVFGTANEPDREQNAVVFLENVPGLLLDPDSDTDRWAMDVEPDDSLGGMGTVLRDLAGFGFDAEWGCIRASDVGASHGRKRVFILAYREGDNGRRGTVADAGNGLLPKSRRRSGGRNGTRSRGAILADSASSGAMVHSGIRECSTVERTGNQLGDSPDGSNSAMGHAECSRAIVLGAGRSPRDTVGESDGNLGIFAYGPADPRWESLLVSRPWLRPSWSQAEAESYFRSLDDGMASLVAIDRTSALRTLGNGVVPLQAAYGFVLLARRAGLI